LMFQRQMFDLAPFEHPALEQPDPYQSGQLMPVSKPQTEAAGYPKFCHRRK
jgi:hypothetical protein